MKQAPVSHVARSALLVALALASVAAKTTGAQGNVHDAPPAFRTSAATTLVNSLGFVRFKQNIETLAAFGDRFAPTASYADAAAWVEAELGQMGYTVEFHDYILVPYDSPQRNLYVTKVGTRRPDLMYIVSAHLDGRGGGGAADDDASGSSLVLEAARAFARPDLETEVSVRFVFWSSEEVGPVYGSTRYVGDRQALRGVESPPGSGLYPEPNWLGIIQHDMLLFDHGLPPGPLQIQEADLDVEYHANASPFGPGEFEQASLQLAGHFVAGNLEFAVRYPAESSAGMCCTDSAPFIPYTAAISVRENRRQSEIGQGANPHRHQATDVFATYDEADFRLGFDAVRMTTGTVAELSGATLP